MFDDIPAEVARVARRRIAENQAEILRSLDNVEAGNPLASEKSPARLVARLMTKNAMAREEAEATALGIRAYAQMSDEQRTMMLRTSAEPPARKRSSVKPSTLSA